MCNSRPFPQSTVGFAAAKLPYLFKKFSFIALLIVSSALWGADSSALPMKFDVYAQANNSNRGVGLATMALVTGDMFSVDAEVEDFWSAGTLPGWSNGDGLTTALLADGSDESGESGEPAATTIAGALPLFTQNGLNAWAAKTLNLFYWDSNNIDSSNYATTSVNVVPEPTTLGLILLGASGLIARRRARPVSHPIQKEDPAPIQAKAAKPH